MALKSARPRYLMTGAFLFAASWVGYWIGYIAHHPTVQKQDVIAQQRLEIMPKYDRVRPIEDPLALQQFKEFKGPLKETKDKVDSDSEDDLSSENKPERNGKNLKGDAAGNDVLLDSVRAKMAEQAVLRERQWAQQQQQGALNEQQLLHKQYIAQQREELEGRKERQRESEKQQRVQHGEETDVHYSLIHSGEAGRIHGQIHEHLKSLPDHVDKDTYIFQADRLPKDPRKRPSVGNGHVATVIHTTTVHMNGLYNGYQNRSHRAIIPSTCAFNVTSTEPASNFTRTYRLNVGEGIYSETSESDTYTLTQRLYAHRNLSRLLVVEIDLVRKQLLPLTLNIQLNKWTASRDVTFLSRDSGMEEVSYKFGRTNAAETDWVTPSEVHVLYDHVPNQLVAPDSHRRVKWVFLSALGHSKQEVYEAYHAGAALIKSNDALYSSHVQAWAELWSRGRIDVAGNSTLARALYGSHYYTLSSMPLREDRLSPFVGLSPSGLPYGTLGMDYQGHVFWDQETWMYPPILFFHSDLAKLLLGTRNRTAKTAEKFAKENGRKGMQFPWESAFTGWDVTPDKNCSEYELHISGDIAYAIVQYLYATGDTSIIKGAGTTYADILAGIAHFWVSKLAFNQQLHKYEIKNVMPPDEDAAIRNNSVYTNTIAKMSLLAIEYALRLLNQTDKRWTRFADDIYIPFDAKYQYHPEYDRYVKGTLVKQADVVLLGYPLLQHMPPEVRMNDLSYYQQVTRSTGPAMTWCMYSIGWLELSDKRQGDQFFHRNFNYIDQTFQVWNEERTGEGAANFITGMGGFLQNVIFGYGGFRLHSNQLDFNPTLPPGANSITFVDIDYLGSSLDFFVSPEEMLITLKRQKADAPKLLVYIYSPEQVHSLVLNKVLKLQPSRGALLSAGDHLPENDTL